MPPAIQIPPHAARSLRVARWIGALVAGLVLLLGIRMTAAPLPKSVPEPQMKGELLIRLAYVVTWPTNVFQSPTQPFRVGILGTDPLGEAVEQAISQRKVSGRSFEIVRSAQPKDLTSCQIVFISKAESKNLAGLLPVLRKPGILMVGETEKFCQEGGMVSLLRVDGLPQIDFHIGNTRAAALDISGHLANTQGVRFVDRVNK
jgi:YfiR/HmsC-like